MRRPAPGTCWSSKDAVRVKQPEGLDNSLQLPVRCRNTHHATAVTVAPRCPPASTVASFMRRTSATATAEPTPYASASPAPRMSAASVLPYHADKTSPCNLALPVFCVIHQRMAHF